jgi:hypothetical protein
MKLSKFSNALVSIAALILIFAVFSCGKAKEKSLSVTAFSGSHVESGRPVADLADYRIAYYEAVPGNGDDSQSGFL